MQLKVISATNFKGKTFTYKLGAGTAIIGPNFAGKTAVVQALVLLFKGYIPQIGKTPKATWELSSGQEMVVRGEFDNGGWIKRRFQGSGAPELEAIGPGGSGVEISELEDVSAVPLLDADEYFGMTDSQRTNYVFARIKLPEIYTPEAIIAELEQISFEEGHTEQIQKAKKEQVAVMAGYFAVTASIQEALESAVEGLKVVFTHWNRRAKETQGAVKTLTELKLREKEISTDSLGALKVEIEAAQSTLQGLVETKGRLTAQRDEIARNKSAIAVLEQRLAAECTNYDAQISLHDGFIREQTERLVTEDPEGFARRKAIRLEVADQIKTLEASIAEGRRIKAEHQASLNSIGDMKCCPTCKAKAKGWKNKVEEELTASLDAVRGQIKKAEEQLVSFRERWSDVDKLIMADEKHASDNLIRSRSIENTQRDLENIVKSKAADQERRQEWETDLKERQGWVAPVMERSLDDIEEERVSAAGKLAKLRERQTAATELQQDLKRAAEAKIEHLEAVAHVNVIKRIQGILLERKATIVSDVFNTLLVTANRIFGSIFQTPLALHEGTIGRWSLADAKFIPHRTFSGTEKALAYIAVAVALSSQAPIRLAILDEFGRLDEDNQLDVLKNLVAAVDGNIIDQFIVVGTSLPSPYGSNEVIGFSDKFELQVIRMKP